MDLAKCTAANEESLLFLLQCISNASSLLESITSHSVHFTIIPSQKELVIGIDAYMGSVDIGSKADAEVQC